MKTIWDDQSHTIASSKPSTDNPSIDTPVKDSATIRRLMEEVRCEEMTVSSPAAYNRQHNRHNR
jgi:hypothetical protein